MREEVAFQLLFGYLDYTCIVSASLVNDLNSGDIFPRAKQVQFALLALGVRQLWLLDLGDLSPSLMFLSFMKDSSGRHMGPGQGFTGSVSQCGTHEGGSDQPTTHSVLHLLKGPSLAVVLLADSCQ